MGRQILLAAGLMLGLAASAAAQEVAYSTWFGGPDENRLTGAAVMPDGAVTVAGLEGSDLKVPLPGKVGLRPGDGLVARLSPLSGEVLNAFRLTSAPTDLRGDEAGSVYLTGSGGSARYDVRGRIVWSNAVGGPDARIVSGPVGSALVLAGGSVTVISPRGSATKSWKVEADVASDIACDPTGQTAFVTGYKIVKGEKGPVQVAFIYAYDGAGQLKWKAYDFLLKDLEAAGLAANTRGCRLHFAGDHKLYVAGEAASANSLWTRLPQDLSKKAALAGGDKFQDAAGAAGPVGFVARFDSKTGALEGGMLLVARGPDDKLGAVQLRALVTDETGRLYVGGAAEADTPVSTGAFGGKFSGGGAFFMIFNSDFKRLYATKVCVGQINAISVGEGFIAVVGEGRSGLTPFKPIQKDFGGGASDGWVVVLSRGVASAPVPVPEKAAPEKAAPPVK